MRLVVYFGEQMVSVTNERLFEVLEDHHDTHFFILRKSFIPDVDLFIP